MAVGIFFLCSPACPKQPRTSFPFYKFFYPTISAKISEFIQELGFALSNWLYQTQTFLFFHWDSHQEIMNAFIIVFQWCLGWALVVGCCSVQWVEKNYEGWFFIFLPHAKFSLGIKGGVLLVFCKVIVISKSTRPALWLWRFRNLTCPVLKIPWNHSCIKVKMLWHNVFQPIMLSLTTFAIYIYVRHRAKIWSLR